MKSSVYSDVSFQSLVRRMEGELELLLNSKETYEVVSTTITADNRGEFLGVIFYYRVK